MVQERIGKSGRYARRAAIIPAWRQTGMAWLGTGLSLAIFLTLLQWAPAVIGGREALLLSWNWVPALGVRFSFMLDGLSLLFSLIISGIGALIFTYSSAYFKSHPQAMRICLIMILFMLSMLGLVLADDIITLFIFWELTTLTSYLLIGTKHEEAYARRFALQALMVTAAGGLCFLAGLILLGQAAGSYQLSAIIQLDLTTDALYLPIFVLVLLGCITKSALFPFHFWLPNAMAAPTPISAYLHSATMVKAGLYMLARLHPTLSGTEYWYWCLLVLGLVTAVWASVQALRQTDFKLMMAHTTVMALGTVAIFLAADTAMALMAALVFLLVHALYKAALFMVVGNLEKASGSRDWRVLGGLYPVIPFTALAAALSALSMIGVPPFFGFIGKEMLLEAALHLPHGGIVTVAGVMLAAALMAAIGFFIAIKPFYGRAGDGDINTEKTKSLSVFLILPPMILALAGLIAGLAAPWGITPLLQAAAGSLSPEAGQVSLSLWHGFGLVPGLSLLVILTGAALACKFSLSSGWSDRLLGYLPISGDMSYNFTLAGILRVAIKLEQILQNGRQRYYVMTVFMTFSLLIWLTLLYRPFVPQDIWLWPQGVPIYQWVLCGFIAASVLITIFSQSRMLAICALGTIGTGLALLFIIFSSPDVAMTQFMVDILVVIILTLVILRLPIFYKPTAGLHLGRVRDAIVALFSGSSVTILMLSVVKAPFDDSISRYYAMNSYVEAKGRNIVNVILVDFRAMDTMGEILVVAIAALACYALIKLRTRKPKAAEQQGESR